jgi:PAS domain S-box-containing protein
MKTFPHESFDRNGDRDGPNDEFQKAAGTLRAIVDGSPMAIVATDLDGKVTIWNSYAERILKFPCADVIGRPSPFPFETGEEVHDREYRVLRGDGVEIDVVCSVAPLCAEGEFPRMTGGDVRGHVAMFRDITERKRLRRRIEQSQKLESLGVLAGGVAHDFNNLLTGILGNASLGLYSLDRTSDVRPLLEEIVRAGERAAALTRQLLAYAGKGRFVSATLDLSDLAREVATLAQASVQNHRVKLHLDLASGIPPIEGDPGQLQQVILNLIINGAEAIEEGSSGFVRVATRVETVSEGVLNCWEAGDTLAPGRYAVLEISDNGVGMDESTRGRVFEPFFSTKFTGRGLGLSAVLGIVRQHGGALMVTSELGAGSTFRALFPEMAMPATPLNVSPDEELDGAGLILVVDDEESVRSIIRRSLERWNYSVIMAENGQAALEILPRLADRLRAVILDLTMPVMGGEETLEHLLRVRPEIPVILASGYSEGEAMRRMEGKGVAAFLQKPFTAAQVARRLRDVLKWQAKAPA